MDLKTKTVEPKPSDPKRRLVKKIAAWAVAALLFVLLFSRVPVEDVLREFGEMELSALAGLSVLSLAFIIGVAILDGTAMWKGFNLFGLGLRWKEIALARTAMMILATIATPIGQAGLAAHISARHKVEFGRATGMVLYLFMLEAYGMIALATLSLPVFYLARNAEASAAPLAAAAAMVGLAWPALALVFLAGRRLGDVKLIRRFRVHALFYPLKSVSFSDFAKLLGLKTLLAAWQIGLTVFAFRLYGIEAPVLDLYALMPLAILVSSIPIAPGRLGITQVSWVFFFGYLAPEASLVALSLLLQFLLNLARWLLGALALPFVRDDFERAREERPHR